MSDLIGLQDLKETSKKPHVVILGAGATRAAFPKGDRNGKRVPLMCDFIETLKLESIIMKYNKELTKVDNFELFFSDLFLDARNKALIEELEKTIRGYFCNLILPAHPTLYDHLILSLREKDVIATFNWDPFLWQAGIRIYNQYQITDKLPKIFFLHGNVAICFDPIEKRKQDISLYNSQKNKICKLLYPIRQKNYQQDNFILQEWKAVQRYLSEANILTIFGYSAPKIDQEAIELLQAGWGNEDERKLEQIEIIDLKSKSELSMTWKSFIHSHHYTVENDFYRSFIAKYPRRSVEAMNRQNLYSEFLDGGVANDRNNSPWKMNFYDLKDWFLKMEIL